ncbi:hypothetical protein [Pseudomonas japonica]|uniref:hypothetical protein n=1 Tax=Pseudomonas japonica TaxID=256466 RepID=UPI0015E4055F|nr:hypothetical protein [Pseudomonas japonica]MBA1245821.1 hypothetical protein [Pseudomonas japonica]
MVWQLFAMPLLNVIEGIVDACRDSVKPRIGSVVYCDLAFGYMEHSGIYVGDNRIVHLTGDGIIEFTTPKGFLDGGTGVSIYVSALDEGAVGSQQVADRALAMVGKGRSYNFLLDNCHQFTSGCLTGNFENSRNFLRMVKDDSRRVLGSNTWRHWDINPFK